MSKTNDIAVVPFPGKSLIIEQAFVLPSIAGGSKLKLEIYLNNMDGSTSGTLGFDVYVGSTFVTTYEIVISLGMLNTGFTHYFDNLTIPANATISIRYNAYTSEYELRARITSQLQVWQYPVTMDDIGIRTGGAIGNPLDLNDYRVRELHGSAINTPISFGDFYGIFG